MDERKLNINAPLMSVRRSSATSPSLTETKRKTLEQEHTSPCYKTDMTLDQVTEPVAVPFNWEYIPGRPKGNGVSEPQPPKEASITPSPSLPPGKSTNVAKQPLKKECNIADKSSSSSGSVIKIECEKEKKDEKIRSNVEKEKEDDDDDDVYSDAVETLSPTESFSINCSVSGLDNLDANKSGTFSSDKQTQDFMMSRFLPAAKAMTVQPPQYASRKESVPVEQLRDVTKLIRRENKSFVNKNITDIVPYTGQVQEEEVEEEEEESGDEVDDYDKSANISAKGCGFLPRLRVGNSLCLMNPVPGMKMRNQFPMSSAYEVGKANKSSHIRSYSPAPAIKKAWDAIHKRKSCSGYASPDMHEVRKKWTNESNRFAYSGELKQLGRLSSFRRSRAASGGSSSFRSAPQSPFHGARLPCDSKQPENNQSGKLKFPIRGHASVQKVQSQGARKSSNSGSLTIEKTLYIDSASTVKSSCSNSTSIDNIKRIDAVVEREGKERNSAIESFQDMKQDFEKNLDSEVFSSVNANSLTLSSMLPLKVKEDKAERLTADQKMNQKAMSLQLVQGSFDEDTKINNLQIVVVDDSGKVLPPPLPKSPSDSWLCRALPLVYLKNPYLHSNHVTQFHAKRQGSNTSSRYTKWETIVKTSNLHHDHVRCSQELTIYKSQH